MPFSFASLCLKLSSLPTVYSHSLRDVHADPVLMHCASVVLSLVPGTFFDHLKRGHITGWISGLGRSQFANPVHQNWWSTAQAPGLFRYPHPLAASPSTPANSVSHPPKSAAHPQQRESPSSGGLPSSLSSFHLITVATSLSSVILLVELVRLDQSSAITQARHSLFIPPQPAITSPRDRVPYHLTTTPRTCITSHKQRRR